VSVDSTNLDASCGKPTKQARGRRTSLAGPILCGWPTASF